GHVRGWRGGALRHPDSESAAWCHKLRLRQHEDIHNCARRRRRRCVYDAIVPHLGGALRHPAERRRGRRRRRWPRRGAIDGGYRSHQPPRWQRQRQQ
ncbi:unnamed protein product, partial [Ectocarpus sp. 12 AP-2014]